MTDRNSVVEHQLRPDELMAELGIKKQAYYDYLRHLGIKAEKDSKGKVYLTQDQAKMMRALREHVAAGGKIEAFDFSNSDAAALTVADAGELDQAAEPVDPTAEMDMEALYLEASEIAAQRLTAGEQVVMAMASQMTYEDLHPTTKAKVDQLREASIPKFNPQEVAANLLSQCRQQMAVA